MELVIFIGLQASGKSTLYHSRFSATHVHVSKDNFRHNKDRNRRQENLIAEALAQGRSVVVDNTNPTPADRTPLIGLGRSFGATVVGYYFESRMEDCKARNAARQGVQRVPDVALHATMSKLERPSRAEGFDQLFHVRLTEAGFVVSDWVEESQADPLSDLSPTDGG